VITAAEEQATTPARILHRPGQVQIAMPKNVFILGADAFNLAQMEAVCGPQACRFHVLARYDEVRLDGAFPVAELLARSRQALRAFAGPVDGILGWWDFPVSTLLPVLRRELGTPGASLEGVLRCEHKYWSRLEQARCVPGHMPRFALVDPFATDPLAGVDLAFPFWIKPVKSASSYLAFKVRGPEDLAHALGVIRREIYRFAEPFDRILAHADLPPEVAGIGGRYCIAEADISRGRQCTLEGYVFDGAVQVYGVVDSIREGRHRSCFARYQYPSTLPRAVQGRMVAIARRFLRHIGYDGSPFDAEFYWEADRDLIWLLEVNTRISKSHCPLFEMVDGEYHHKVNLDLALGRRPDFPHRQGRYRVAAKFMLRRYSDAVVRRVPSEEDILAVQARFPDTRVQVHVREGTRLSELPIQDSYSFEVAVVFMGAESQAALLRDYRTCLAMLDFRFDEEAL
jgi:biotin carboxylase